MRSKRRNTQSKTLARKIEAMKKIKQAYLAAQEAGTVKTYNISVD